MAPFFAAASNSCPTHMLPHSDLPVQDRLAPRAQRRREQGGRAVARLPAGRPAADSERRRPLPAAAWYVQNAAIGNGQRSVATEGPVRNEQEQRQGYQKRRCWHRRRTCWATYRPSTARARAHQACAAQPVGQCALRCMVQRGACWALPSHTPAAWRVAVAAASCTSSQAADLHPGRAARHGELNGHCRRGTRLPAALEFSWR